MGLPRGSRRSEHSASLQLASQTRRQEPRPEAPGHRAVQVVASFLPQRQLLFSFFLFVYEKQSDEEIDLLSDGSLLRLLQGHGWAGQNQEPGTPPRSPSLGAGIQVHGSSSQLSHRNELRAGSEKSASARCSLTSCWCYGGPLHSATSVGP